MNTLKPLLTVAVLAGIGYGVYIRINSGADAPPPSGVAAGWDTAPKVQMGDAVAPGGGAPWSSGGAPMAPPYAPPLGSAQGGAAMPPEPRGGEAPSYAPPASGPPPYGSSIPNAQAQGAATAPPFDGQGAVPGVSPDPVPPVPAPTNPYATPAPANPYASTLPSDVPVAAPVGAPPAGPAARYEPAAGPAGPASISVAPASDPGMVVNFPAVMDVAKRDLESGQLAAALRQLSGCYDNPQLAPAEQAQLTQLLDQVAGTVVYSTQHLLEPPYEVQSGERLEDIGQRYNVPWQLLAKINGIDDPQSLRPGERLKVVRGPFSAVVHLEKRQLSLMLADGSYAGRFNIGIGGEHPPREGVYAVSDKLVNPVYQGRDRAIGADDPANPLGERLIKLDGDLAIHGTDRPENVGRTDLPGSISLSPRDVEDVFDILSVGSRVTIRR